MVKKMFTKNIKQKIFFGYLCIFIGLFFGIMFTSLDYSASLASVALGFSVGSFIILMGIIEDIYSEKKYKKVNLACKHDWGNSCYCKNCLSVDNCPVIWGYEKWNVQNVVMKN